MKKQEVIEKIRNLEPDEQNLHEYQPEEWEAFEDGFLAARIGAELIIEELDEPEKPIIPQFVADWLEVCKENLGFGLSSAMSHSTSAMKKQPNKVKGWFNLKDNQETFAKAWLYGYEVEKEKLYTVRLKVSGEYLNSEKANKRYMMGSTNKNFVKELKSYCYTQAELKELNIWDNPAFEVEEVEEND